MPRILIVDDSPLIRRGLRSLLGQHPQFEICGEAVDGHDAVKKARELSPALIILDFAMPRMNGLAAARQICKSNPKCLMLMLTTFLSQPLIEEARAAGIRAAVAKSEVSRLLPEIQSVIRNNEQ